MNAEQMYQQQILDHYRNPRNYGTMEKPDIRQFDTNPLCGDEIELAVKLKDKKIDDIRFTCKGCAISKAAASMLTEIVRGKSMEEARKMTNNDIVKILGVTISPVRMKCALLGLKALQKGLYKHLGEEMKNDKQA